MNRRKTIHVFLPSLRIPSSLFHFPAFFRRSSPESSVRFRTISRTGNKKIFRNLSTCSRLRESAKRRWLSSSPKLKRKRRKKKNSRECSSLLFFPSLLLFLILPVFFFPAGFREAEKKRYHPALRKKISAGKKMCFFICMRFLLSLAVSHFLPPPCFAVHPSSTCHKYFKVIEMQRKTHPRKGVQLRRIRGG